MSSSNKHQHLFEQMADAIADAHQEDVDLSFDFMQNDLQTIEREKVIVHEIAARIEHADALEAILYKGEAPITSTDAIEALAITIDNNPPADQKKQAAYEYLSTLFNIVGDIADCQFDSNVFPKRQVQLFILRADILSHDEKQALIDATNTLIEGPSIDISNPDDVLTAINEQRAQQDQIEGGIATSRKIRVLFDNELSKFEINPEDPEYSFLATLTVFQINMGVETARIVDSAESHLKVLGIGTEEYAVIVDTIARKINTNQQN